MRVLVLLLLALCTTGCPGMGPVNTGGGMPLSQAQLTTPSLSRMRATATISQTEKGKRLSGKVYVMLERPGSIRFDAMSPVDTPMAILTANETSFALMDVKSDAFYTGPPSACNVARMLQIPLPPAAVAGILTGVPPLMDPQEQRLEWKLKGYHLLTLRRLHDKQVVQIVTGRQGTSALRSVYWHKGKIVYDLRFQDHRTAAKSTILPHRISFSMPDRGTVVELVYRSIEIDPDIPEGIFTQDPPPGLPVLHVDCDG